MRGPSTTLRTNKRLVFTRVELSCRLVSVWGSQRILDTFFDMNLPVPTVMIIVLTSFLFSLKTNGYFKTLSLIN